MNLWSTGRITDMHKLFWPKENFNEDICSWDTSSITNMYAMFYEASSFNQPVNRWDTSSVTNMYSMFYEACPFNQHVNIGTLPASPIRDWCFIWRLSIRTSASGIFPASLKLMEYSSLHLPLTRTCADGKLLAFLMMKYIDFLKILVVITREHQPPTTTSPSVRHAVSIPIFWCHILPGIRVVTLILKLAPVQTITRKATTPSCWAQVWQSRATQGTALRVRWLHLLEPLRLRYTLDTTLSKHSS